MRDIYLYYDPISSGYIGMLPEGPMVILVEVFETLKLVFLKVVLPQKSYVILLTAYVIDKAYVHFSRSEHKK